jgi:hypothetical protein
LFSHCIVCHSSIDGFLLHLWHLQTFLTLAVCLYIRSLYFLTDVGYVNVDFHQIGVEQSRRGKCRNAWIYESSIFYRSTPRFLVINGCHVRQGISLLKSLYWPVLAQLFDDIQIVTLVVHAFATTTI